MDRNRGLSSCNWQNLPAEFVCPKLSSSFPLKWIPWFLSLSKPRCYHLTTQERPQGMTLGPFLFLISSVNPTDFALVSLFIKSSPILSSSDPACTAVMEAPVTPCNTFWRLTQEGPFPWVQSYRGDSISQIQRRLLKTCHYSVTQDVVVRAGIVNP